MVKFQRVESQNHVWFHDAETNKFAFGIGSCHGDKDTLLPFDPFNIIVLDGTFDGVILAQDISYHQISDVVNFIADQIHDDIDLRRVVAKYIGEDVIKELTYVQYWECYEG